ncbi:MAG: glycoside hydrolase family 44 protein [Trueperaceae bacterium]|nr:glycoside hydrolase family 44 protein [Trueperaceae bacterium]
MKPFILMLTVIFLGSSACTPAQPQNPNPPADIILTINTTENRKPISPYIYGLNFATEAFAKELDLPLRRWGGNALSRYNYKNNATNLASDFFFLNVDNFNPITGASETADNWIAQNKRTATDSVVTIPMMGFVAKDTTSCGFSIAKYGEQDNGDDPDRPTDCGSGIRTDGSPVNGNLAIDTSTAIDSTFIKDWVSHLKNTHGSAGSGGVRFYALDNEPELWSETHRDIHPMPLSYDELLQRSLAYGEAIKETDPEAQLFGYVSFGWSGYFYSQRDLVEAEKNGYTAFPDYDSHDSKYQLEWYLEQMQSYEEAKGKRLLDYLDLHFYPQNGVDLSLAGDAAKQALRLRSVRALWDPSYRDESWIGDAGQPEDWQKVRLIPRMHDWVDTLYPGTKLALTEYNWGGLESINGALAQAEILGIFGREGLDLAALWNYPDKSLGYDHFESLPGAYAFRIFRNYDGAGAKFGETSVNASSSDETQLSVFAAERSSDKALTVVIINKAAKTLTANLSLTGVSTTGNAEIFRYSDANLGIITKETGQAISNTFSFPKSSISLLVVKR